MAKTDGDTREYTGRHTREGLAAHRHAVATAEEALHAGDEFDIVAANAEDSLPGVALADTDTPTAAVADVDGSSSGGTGAPGEAATPGGTASGAAVAIPVSPDAPASAASDSRVARNTALMSVATLGSRVTGLIRTWVMAFALGNTLITSAYSVANNMPNVLYDLVAGGILGAAFIPVYLLQKERAGQDGGNLFANNILNLTIVVLGILSLVAAIFAPAVIATQTFTVENTAEVTRQAVFFFRIFAIQLLFYGIGGVVNGILNAERIYFLPALAPALNNLLVIAAFLAYIPLNRTNPALANTVLAVGTTLGVAVQAFIQIPALRKTGYRWRPVIDLHDPALIEAVKIAVPTALYIVGALVAFSCRNAFSLWSGDEGPSVLVYAWMWFQLPYGVLAVSLSRTMFTEMSVDAAKENLTGLREHIVSGINVTLLLIIPLAALMGVFSESIMQLFQAGRFSAEDVVQVARVLTLWVIGLPFYSVWMYLYNVFAAMRKFFRFAILNTVFVVLQCGLYALLCPANALGLAGVPIADVVFYTLGCVATLMMLTKMIGRLGLGATLWRAVRIVLASAVGVGIAWALMRFFPLGGGGMLQGILQLVLYGSISLVVIFALCAALRLPEMDTVLRLAKRLFRR